MLVLSARGARRRAATGRQLFSCALPLLSHGGASANLRRRVRLQFLPPIGRQSHWMAGDADATAGEAAAARKRRDQRDDVQSVHDAWMVKAIRVHGVKYFCGRSQKFRRQSLSVVCNDTVQCGHAAKKKLLTVSAEMLILPRNSARPKPPWPQKITTPTLSAGNNSKWGLVITGNYQ